jgi:hypothetical protein
LALAGAPARVPPRLAALALPPAADLRPALGAEVAPGSQRAARPEQDLEPALPKQSPVPAVRSVPPASPLQPAMARPLSARASAALLA